MLSHRIPQATEVDVVGPDHLSVLKGLASCLGGGESLADAAGRRTLFPFQHIFKAQATAPLALLREIAVIVGAVDPEQPTLLIHEMPATTMLDARHRPCSTKDEAVVAPEAGGAPFARWPWLDERQRTRGRRLVDGARMVGAVNSCRHPRPSLMKSIDEHIQKDRVDIEQARAAGDLGKVRHLEEELKGLEEYKSHHPEDSHDPTPLEVYCDLNPEAPECRVYDD